MSLRQCLYFRLLFLETFVVIVLPIFSFSILCRPSHQTLNSWCFSKLYTFFVQLLFVFFLRAIPLLPRHHRPPFIFILFAFVAFFVQGLFKFVCIWFVFCLHFCPTTVSFFYILFAFVCIFCIFCPTAVSIFPAQFPYYRATNAHQYHSWVVKQRHPGSSLLFNKCICEFTFRLD